MAWVLLLFPTLICVLWLRRRRQLQDAEPQLSAPLPPGLDVGGVERFLKERDDREAPLQQGVRSDVRWASTPGTVTETAVLFLHGWATSPEEIDPVDTEIARHLGANLLRLRLTGHGLAPPDRGGDALRDTATRSVLLRDAAIAFALGRLVGRRVVIIGCSTGGTLATWVASQEWARSALAAAVLISPGFALSIGGRAYGLAKWPVLLLPAAAARAIVHAIAGPEHHVPYVSEEQRRVVTMAYPSEAVVNLCELYTTVEVGADIRAIARARLPILVYANPGDPVVSYDAMLSTLSPAGAQVEFVIISNSEEPHLITGRIYSPSTITHFIEHTTAWLRPRLGPDSRS
jgi:pimeloyl-ACP methyl ester carboxylesterase